MATINHPIISMSHVFTPAPALATSRYSRQLLIPSVSLAGQSRIAQSRVLIIGLGGLGAPASLYLAGAGVGVLGFVDHDVVETSNLHRQVVHRESSVNPVLGSQNRSPGGDATDEHTNGPAEPMSKVDSAIRGCRELNSEIVYLAHDVALSGGNALDIIVDYDIVLDCTDNPAARYLISDCCVVLGKTLISGAAQRLEGQICVLNWPIYDTADLLTNQDEMQNTSVPNGSKSNLTTTDATRTSPTLRSASRGPCYRCVFPHPPAPDLVKGCSEIGILGPVVGTIGTLMASETLRLMVKPDEARKPTMLLYNAWPSDPRSMFRTIGLRGRRKDCLACGEEEVVRGQGRAPIDAPSIRHGLMDYQSFCGAPVDVKLLSDQQRVNACEFLSQIQKGKGVIVDVREEIEVELGSKLSGSINIPLSRIQASGYGLKGKDTPGPLDRLLKEHVDQPLYFVCQRGNDSQVAARRLLDRKSQGQNPDEQSEIASDGWIGDVEGGFNAIEQLLSH